MNNCKYCGKEISDEKEYCDECEKYVDEYKASELKRLKIQNTIFLIIIILNLIVITYNIISMIIYANTEHSCINNNISMSVQEIEAFNSQYTVYGGEQTGAKLKSMIDTLITNGNTLKENPDKMPGISIDKAESGDFTNGHPNNENWNDYIEILSTMKKKLENKTKYKVDFEYAKSGILTNIIITKKN